MISADHTIRGCTTAMDLDTAATHGVDWLAVPGDGSDTLYVTSHDGGGARAHVFSDPAERRALRRVLSAILHRPEMLSLASD